MCALHTVLHSSVSCVTFRHHSGHHTASFSSKTVSNISPETFQGKYDFKNTFWKQLQVTFFLSLKTVDSLECHNIEISYQETVLINYKQKIYLFIEIRIEFPIQKLIERFKSIKFVASVWQFIIIKNRPCHQFFFSFSLA